MPVLSVDIAMEDYLKQKSANTAPVERQIVRIEERVATHLGFGVFAGAEKPTLSAQDYTLYLQARADVRRHGPWGAGVALTDWNPGYGLTGRSARQGARRLLLPLYPVNSIAAVHQDEAWVFGEGSLVDDAHYMLFRDTWALVKVPGAAPWSTVGRSIRVKLNAGYTALNTPDVLIDAVGKQLAHEWKNRDKIGLKSVGADGATTAVRSMELLPGVRQQLAPFRLPVAAGVP